MSPISLYPAMLALTIAIAFTFAIVRFSPINIISLKESRFISIDGLRGYLAFFVFIHHSSVWYFYLRTGDWAIPPSNIYTQFGQTSVSYFFMITAFLFTLKLLENKNIDWGRLFISRVLRIAPLYLFSVIIVLIIVTYLTGGQLQVPLWKLTAELINWIAFSIYGMTNINGLSHTAIIVAEVTWSLSYEWFFYLLLPLMALMLGIRPPVVFVVFSIFTLGMILFLMPEGKYVLSFLAGICAAYAVRFENLRVFARKRIASIVAIIALLIEVNCYSSAYSLIPQFLIFVSFVLFVCGNDLFGVLSNPISRALGEVSYSIYLLHGILIFIVMNFILGLERARALDSQHYWLVIICIIPFLILICFLTFRFIEYPAMQSTSIIINKIRSKRQGK